MKTDMIGVAEIFLNADVGQAEISIEGYSKFRKDRCQFMEGKEVGHMLKMILYHMSTLNLIQISRVRMV